MKKTSLMVLFVVLGLATVQAQQVAIQDIAPFTYAYLECRGSYEQMPSKISQFSAEFFKQRLVSAGPLFGCYLNSPQQVKPDELQWQIGFPVTKDAKVSVPLSKAEMTFNKGAVYLHVGPYGEVGKVYEKIFQSIFAQGYIPAGPCFERYLDQNPQAVKPEELRTEIVVPVLNK